MITQAKMTPRIYYYEIRARANREEREREGGAGVENGGEKRADFGGAPPTFSGFSFFFFLSLQLGSSTFSLYFSFDNKKEAKRKEEEGEREKKTFFVVVCVKRPKRPCGVSRSVARSLGRSVRGEKEGANHKKVKEKQQKVTPKSSRSAEPGNPLAGHLQQQQHQQQRRRRRRRRRQQKPPPQQRLDDQHSIASTEPSKTQ